MVIFFDIGLLLVFLVILVFGVIFMGARWVVENAGILTIIGLIILLIKYIYFFIIHPSKRSVVIYMIGDILRMVPATIYAIFFFAEFYAGRDGIGLIISIIFGGVTCLLLIGVAVWGDFFLMDKLAENDGAGKFVGWSVLVTTIVLAVGAVFVLPDLGEDIQLWIQTQTFMLHSFAA